MASEQDHAAEIERLEREVEAERARTERWRRVADERRMALDRIRGRWTVRALLAFADLVLPVVRRSQWRIRDVFRRLSRVRRFSESNPGGMREAELAQAMAATRKPARDPRSVAAIVLARSANLQLDGVVNTLRATHHKRLDIVIVDTAEGQGRLQLGQSDGIRILHRDSDLSVGAARNEAVRQVDTDVVLFFSDCLEPLDGHWLARMLERLTEDVAVVGAHLVSPLPERRSAEGSAASVAHLGFGLNPAGDGPPQLIEITGGTPDLERGPRDVMAVSSACFLVDRSAFIEVGGFDRGCEPGADDLDLCWRLRAAGRRIVVDPEAVLRYRGRNVAGEREPRNEEARDLLAGRFGPAMRHAVDNDRLSGSMALSDRAFAIGITTDRGRGSSDRVEQHKPGGLGAGLAEFGWKVRYLDQAASRRTRAMPDLDALLVSHHRLDVRRVARPGLTVIAWVAGETERWLDLPWFEAFDLVIASSQAVADQIRSGSAWRYVPVASVPATSERTPSVVTSDRPDGVAAPAPALSADRLRNLIREHRAKLSVAVRIEAPNRRAAATWGDTYFAEALVAQLRMAGHHAVVQTLNEWSNWRGKGFDISLQLKGRASCLRTEGQINVLWVISHPNELDPADVAAADVVFVASALLAEELRNRSSTPIHVLLQATDDRRFHPTAVDPEYDHRVVFLGNSRSVERPVVRDALMAGLPLTVYGTRWERFVPPDVIAARFVPNHEVPAVYSSANVVLNDHWPDMREWGLVSNRLFDALACGACVVTDRVAGVEELFGDAVAVAEGPEELGRIVHGLLADPDRRREMGRRGREIVVAEHTFRHRVEALLAVIEGVADIDGQPRAGKGGASPQ